MMQKTTLTQFRKCDSANSTTKTTEQRPFPITNPEVQEQLKQCYKMGYWEANYRYDGSENTR